MGASALIIGLLIGVYDFAELFAKPFAGFITDRKGMKLTLLFGLGIAGLLAALIFGTFLRENSGQTEVSNLQ
jgi:MFS family permease